MFNSCFFVLLVVFKSHEAWQLTYGYFIETKNLVISFKMEANFLRCSIILFRMCKFGVKCSYAEAGVVNDTIDVAADVRSERVRTDMMYHAPC